jgi:hypothetical protein
MKRLLTSLLVLLLVGSVDAATIWITGFEHGLSPTGNIGEPDIMIVGAGSTFDTTTVHSGGFALKQLANFSRIYLDTLGPSVATMSCRMWVMFKAGSPPGSQIFLSTSTTTLFSASWNGTTLNVGSSGAGFSNVSGSITIPADVWTMIQFAYDAAAGGVGKTWVNGVLDVNTTHTGAQANVTRFSVAGDGSNGYFFDDIHCNDTLTPPPDGRVITRRPIAGSPVDTGFTLSGCATIQECWSETPWSATKSANSGSTTAAVAQTAIVNPVTTTQSPFGTTVIPANATINAVQVQAIATTSNVTSGGQAGNIRYRINGGAAVDCPITFITVVDRGWPQVGSSGPCFFTTSVANLDLMEIGWKKDASAVARTHTVEDVWLTVDFSESTGIQRKVIQD